MGEGRVFFVFSGLELLLSVAGDGISFGSRLHFEVSLLDLDFLGADLGLVEPSGGVGDLFFACLALLGEVCEFRLEASKALVAVLQGEQLFDHIEHCRMMTGPLEIIQRAVCRACEEALGQIGKALEKRGGFCGPAVPD